MMQLYMQQQSRQQQGVDFGSASNGTPDYNPETSFSPQRGLLGRLLSLQAEQSGYQPSAENSEQTSVSPDPDYRQLARVPISAQPQAPTRTEGTEAAATRSTSQNRQAAALSMVRSMRQVCLQIC
jgi:hypothetical protein